jgi:hypothetical protein
MVGGPLPAYLRPGGMDEVWEALARLEAARRAARVQAALMGLGAQRIGMDVSKPDSLLDTAGSIAEAEGASLQAGECAVEIERSRRAYLEAGIPAEQLELAVLQAWARDHWQINADPRLALMLHWLRSPWDDAEDLAVTIVQMIGRINAEPEPGTR